MRVRVPQACHPIFTSSYNNVPSGSTQTLLPTDYPCHILCHLSSIFPCLFPVIYFVFLSINPNFCALFFRLSSVIYPQSYHPHPYRLFPVIYKLAVNFTPNFFQSNPSHFQTHIIVYENLMKNDKYYGSLRSRDNRWGEV